MATKRSGKFYRKNEQQIMSLLGLQPTVNSGSGWIEKEDGQSEHVLCQLKSTDASSIKINLQDIQTLEYNASVSKKLPVFAIQYLQTDSLYLVIRPQDLQDVAKYIATGQVQQFDLGLQLGQEEQTKRPQKVIKSSADSREQFRSEIEAKRTKKGRSAT